VLNLTQNAAATKIKTLKNQLVIQQALTLQHLRRSWNSLQLTQSVMAEKLTPAETVFNLSQTVDVEVLPAQWRRYTFLCVYSDGHSHQTVEMNLETLKRLLKSIR